MEAEMQFQRLFALVVASGATLTLVAAATGMA